MKFTSKYGGYNLAVAEPEIEYYRDGRQRQIRPAIFVDFGEQALGPEAYEGFDGDPSFVQLRGGGFFDTEVAQRDKRWTDEERELAEQRLLEIAENGPRADYYRTLPARDRPPGFGDVRIWTRVKPTAPWPTYQSVPPGKVAKLAAEMGLVAEALNYEQRLFDDDRRPEVIEALQAEFDRLEAEQELTAVGEE
jgi:hypothetical protein